jgi:hypothetical protein
VRPCQSAKPHGVRGEKEKSSSRISNGVIYRDSVMQRVSTKKKNGKEKKGKKCRTLRSERRIASFWTIVSLEANATCFQ